MRKAEPIPVAPFSSEFDVEGFLFINFPTDDWLSGRARQTVEALVRLNGDEYLSPVTMMTALFAARLTLDRGTPPWVKEARWRAERPDLARRFAPYWRKNSGSHPKRPKPKPATDIWGEPIVADIWGDTPTATKYDF